MGILRSSGLAVIATACLAMSASADTYKTKDDGKAHPAAKAEAKVEASVNRMEAKVDRMDRPDAWITMKTKMSLLAANDVPGFGVNVDTVDGVVYLYGSVDSATQKSRVESIAHGIEGVREVRNYLTVAPGAKRTVGEDAKVQAQLASSLQSDRSLGDSKIKVKSVNNGVVVLSGDAMSMSDQMRAINIAYDTPGVVRVTTEMRGPAEMRDEELNYDDNHDTKAGTVAANVGDSLTDAAITTNVKLKLMADSNTPAHDINVDTRNRVVTLFGVVPTDDSKATAAKIARDAKGVRDVHNELTVKPESAQAKMDAKDDDLENAIEKQLATRPAFSSVEVEVSNGVARLTGHVASNSDRLRAGWTARGVAGVHSVQNDLLVKAPSEASLRQ